MSPQRIFERRRAPASPAPGAPARRAWPLWLYLLVALCAVCRAEPTSAATRVADRSGWSRCGGTLDGRCSGDSRAADPDLRTGPPGAGSSASLCDSSLARHLRASTRPLASLLWSSPCRNALPLRERARASALLSASLRTPANPIANHVRGRPTIVSSSPQGP